MAYMLDSSSFSVLKAATHTKKVAECLKGLNAGLKHLSEQNLDIGQQMHLT